MTKNNVVLKLNDALKGFLFRAYHVRRCINVGQILPDDKIKRHSRMSLSGIPTAFNNAQGGDPRLKPSGMTTNLNKTPALTNQDRDPEQKRLRRTTLLNLSPLTLPSPSWRGNATNFLPPGGGRCPVGADEGGCRSPRLVEFFSAHCHFRCPPCGGSTAKLGRGVAKHALERVAIGQGRGKSAFPARSVIPQACNAGYSGRSGFPRGFTLIELLVVILIIGILAAIAVPQYQLAVEKARTIEAITHIRTIAQAQYLHFMEFGKYAATFEELNIDLPGEVFWDELQMQNWHFILTQVTNHKLVYARRMGMGFALNAGRYYIDYDLTTGKLFCVAYSYDTKATNICKRFGPPQTCPAWGNANSVCYPIP